MDEIILKPLVKSCTPHLTCILESFLPRLYGMKTGAHIN